MKLHHLLQQKISGFLPHLWINFFVLSICIGCSSRESSPKTIFPSQVDSVFVFHMDFDIFFANNLSKEDFLTQYMRNGNINRSIVTDNNKIKQLRNAFSLLQEDKLLGNMGDEVEHFYYRPIVSKSNRLYLINTYPLDIRCLIVIKSGENFIPIWVSTTGVEIKNTFYHTSNELEQWVREIMNVNMMN